jgi:hypothetical protein
MTTQFALSVSCVLCNNSFQCIYRNIFSDLNVLCNYTVSTPRSQCVEHHLYEHLVLKRGGCWKENKTSVAKTSPVFKGTWSKYQ